MPFITPHVPTWPAVRSFLISCWRDPDADESLQAQFRGHQFQAASRSCRCFRWCTLLLVGAALVVFDEYVDHPLVIVCASVLCMLVAFIYLPLWRAWQQARRHAGLHAYRVGAWRWPWR
ncbi:MAG: hypothetical protein IPM80_12495 [Proteobacteria bacterium]|nr:hypothetical protein [Pseudomonadota bacterium]